MRYVMARYKEQRREMAYRIYVTECLRTMTENTARFAGGNYITARLADTVSKPHIDDSKTGEEIVAEVIKKAGLVVRE